MPPKLEPLKGRRLTLGPSGASGPSASQLAVRALEAMDHDATPADIRRHLLTVERISAVPDLDDLQRVLHRRDDWFTPGDRPGTWRLRD